MADANTAPVDTSAIPAGELTDAQLKDEFAALAAAKTAEPEEITDDTVATPPSEPAPAAAVAAAPAAQPAAPAPAAAATDIWATASPEVRAAHQAAIAAEQQKYRSDIGRQASYQSRIAALEAELKTRTAPAAATAEAPKTTSLRENPNLKKTLEEYPDVAGPLVDAFEGSIKSLTDENARLKGDVSTLTDEQVARVYEKNKAAVTAAHPDWQDAIKSREFDDWFGALTPAKRAIIARNGDNIVDPAEAIEALSDFKAHYALTHPRTPPVTPPVAPATPVTPAAPVNLSARRDAQLRAVTATPPGSPAAASVIDTNDTKGLFDYFAGRKSQRK